MSRDIVGGIERINESIRESGFVPSSYDTDLTMDATGETVVLATGVSYGRGRVQIANQGAATEPVRAAFGTSAADALLNLTIAGGAATTGYYIPSAADAGSRSIVVLGVPENATHLGIGPAAAGDTQLVAITQGV